MPKVKEIQVQAGAKIKVVFDATVRFGVGLFKRGKRIYDLEAGGKEKGSNEFPMDPDQIRITWFVVPAENVDWSYTVTIKANNQVVFAQEFANEIAGVTADETYILVTQKGGEEND